MFLHSNGLRGSIRLRFIGTNEYLANASNEETARREKRRRGGRKAGKFFFGQPDLQTYLRVPRYARKSETILARSCILAVTASSVV